MGLGRTILFLVLAACLSGMADGAAEGYEEVADEPVETRIWKVNNPVVSEYNYWLYLLQEPEGPYFDERDTETVIPAEYAGPYFYDETFWDNLTFMYSRSELGGGYPSWVCQLFPHDILR